LKVAELMSDRKGKKLLIIGATTRVGLEVTKLLSATPSCNLRLLVRLGANSRIADTASLEIVHGELTDREALKRALYGVDRLVIIPPNIQQQATAEKAIYEEAVLTGVRHITKLSTSKADRKSRCYFFRQHAAAEEYLRMCGAAFTIVRSNSFMQNMIWFASEIKSHSTFSLPMGNAVIAPIDIRDVARIIAAVAVGRLDRRDVLMVTGAEKLSLAEIAGRLSSCLGRNITYYDVASSQFVHRLQLEGIPSWFASAVADAWSIAKAEPPSVTTVFSEETGKTPIKFQEFVADYLPLFV
jgi:uncharacterized protein YbjT (DUF2867 family)